MRQVNLYYFTPLMLCALLPALVVQAEESPSPLQVPVHVQSVLKTRCIECHGGEDAEGDVRFDNLAELKLDSRLDLLNRDRINFSLEPCLRTTLLNQQLRSVRSSPTGCGRNLESTTPLS